MGFVPRSGEASCRQLQRAQGTQPAACRRWARRARASSRRAKLVESKSLKLFLSSFRNHGAFHEECTLMVGHRLAKVLAPRWLRIGGYWYPRGGMPIDVLWQTGAPPKGLWLPDQGVPPYRGR